MSKTIYEVRYISKKRYSTRREAELHIEQLLLAQIDAELWTCEIVDGGTKIWSLNWPSFDIKADKQNGEIT